MTSYTPIPRHGRLSSAEQTAIDAMYADDHTPDEIGRAIGRTRMCVVRYLQRTNQYAPPDYRFVPPEAKAEAVLFYQAGARIAYIRQRFQIGEASLYHELRKADIPRRKKRRGEP
jgi:hypothetical protein